MNTDWSVEIQKVFKSFSYAITGLAHATKRERNLRIHLTITVLVCILGFYFSISVTKWLIILLAIGGVISLELVNTALERVVDLVTSDYQPLAKQAKDVAAGAVLVYAIIAVIIGILIFLPEIIQRLT
ncbi:diacylglycerol kinase family protein [Bacillus marasmi]|uniref:diacylglycerol kinase family protein n=1 Tax=Bacillus marasmi TaxID=1926279 RepID=UPI0011CBA2CD|nr:diacylglycerol kinase family protein [Bacillus marasmi]